MTNERPTVRIVDDDARNLDSLEVMLEASGCTLIRAQSADEALLAMLRHEFAAMILDIRVKMLQNPVIGVGSPSVRWWVWQLGHHHTRRA